METKESTVWGPFVPVPFFRGRFVFGRIVKLQVFDNSSRIGTYLVRMLEHSGHQMNIILKAYNILNQYYLYKCFLFFIFSLLVQEKNKYKCYACFF